MSSKITAIYDAFKARVEATLPAYKRIPNAYLPEQVSNRILAKGVGYAIGPAFNNRKDLSKQFQLSRQIAVMLTRQMGATENNVDKRSDNEKALLEDLHLVIKAMENDWELVSPDQTAIIAEYDSDTGLSFLNAKDGGEYLVLIATFTVRYSENLQP